MITFTTSSSDLTLLVTTILLACLLSVLASAAGTGGGSLFLPLFSLSLLNVYKAVPLSKTGVLGTSLGACFWNYTIGPDLIDYQLVTLIQPSTLLGCLFGVILNFVLPARIIMLSMCIILGYSAHKTFAAAKRIDAESRNTQELSANDEENLELLVLPRIKSYGLSHYSDLNTPTHSDLNDVKTDITDFSGGYQQNLEISEATELNNINPSSPSSTEISLSAEKAKVGPSSLTSRKIKTIEILYMCFVWIVNITLLNLAGNAAALICGTPKQMLWFWTNVLFLIGFTIFTYKRLKSNRNEQQGHYPLHMMISLQYCSIAFVAGLAAALLGIGGGLIKSPMLIAIGLNPIEAVATSNYMIVFTSSTNVLLYMIAGRLYPMDLSLFTPVTFFGGIMGVWLLRSKLRHMGTQGFLARILAWTIILGCGTMLMSVFKNEMTNNPSTKQSLEEVCNRLK